MNKQGLALLLLGLASLPSLSAAQKKPPEIGRTDGPDLRLLVSQSFKASDSWLFRRDADGAEFHVQSAYLPTAAEALKVSDPNRSSQRRVNAVFTPKSTITDRKIGDAYWTDGYTDGGARIIVRWGTDVCIAWVAKVGKNATGYAEKKLITKADMRTLEDLAIDAIKVARHPVL